MTGLQHYLRTKDGTLLPFAALATPKDMRDTGCWEDIQLLRRNMTHPAIGMFAKEASPKDHVNKKWRTYDLTATQDIFKRNIQLSSVARKMEKTDTAFTTLLSAVGIKILQWKFPKRNMEILLRDWACSAAFTVGHHNNHELNAIQLNFSETNGDAVSYAVSDDIKQHGGLRIEGTDNPLGLTVIINLSNYPDD